MIKKRRFSRTSKLKNALFRSLMRSLILKKRIKTTEAKAKELRPKIERLITHLKKESLASQRTVFQKLQNKNSVKKLKEIAVSYKERPGGYTRILKLGARKSDGARMALIEFV